MLQRRLEAALQGNNAVYMKVVAVGRTSSEDKRLPMKTALNRSGTGYRLELMLASKIQ